MANATVLSITGQAWAVNEEGQRRELKPGDRLADGETLITAPGGSVGLSFDNGQQLHLDGDQQINTQDAMALATTPPNNDESQASAEETEEETAEATPTPPPQNTPPSGDQLQNTGHSAFNLLDTGHSFVRLKRIIETVPELAYHWEYARDDVPEWRQGPGEDDPTPSEQEPERIPGVTIDFIGPVDDAGNVPALITLDDNVRVGDTLRVTDSGGNVLIERSVTQQDLDNGIRLDVPVPDGQTNIDLTATVTTPDGETGIDDDNYTLPTVEIDEFTVGSRNNEISSTLTGGSKNATSVDVVVSGPDGQPIFEGNVFVDENGNWTVDLSDYDLPEGDYTVDVTARDERGNTSEPDNSESGYTLPSVEITDFEVGSTNNQVTSKLTGTSDNATSVDVVVRGPDGEPVFDGNVPVDENGNWTVELPPDLPPDDYSVEATGRDERGNTSDPAEDDSGYILPTVELSDFGFDPQDYTGHDPVSPDYDAGEPNPRLTVEAENATGVVITITGEDGSEQEFDATQDSEGNWTVDLSGGDFDPDVEYTVTAEARDDSGNTSSSNELDADFGLPSVEIDEFEVNSENNQVGSTLTGGSDNATSVDVVVRGPDGEPVFSGNVPVDEDGTWSVDLSDYDLPEGDYTVNATARDERGNSSEPDDSESGYTLPTVEIELQDTGTDGYSQDDVDGDGISPEGTVPAEITLGGSTQVGDTLVITNDDGSFRCEHTVTQNDLDDGLIINVPVATGDDDVRISAEITDSSGNTANDDDDAPISWDLSINIPTDHDADEPADDPADRNINDQVVFESGLVGGSDNDSDTDAVDDLVKVESSFTLLAQQGLAESGTAIELKVGGEVLQLTKEQVENLGTTNQSLDTEYGELVLTGYTENPNGTITIDYEYTLTDAPTVSGDDTDDTIGITVTDQAGDSASGDLNIKIVDDAPVAEDDNNSVTEGDDTSSTGGVSATSGNVIGGGDAADGDEADTTGADGATVTEIQFGTETETVPDGDSVEIKGQYGTLTIHSDGSYTYELDNGNLAVQGLTEGETLEDVFTYTLTDGDGDQDDATLTITINGADDGLTVTVPNPGDPNDPDNPPDTDAYPENPADNDTADLVVFESGLVGGSDNSGTDPVDGLVKVESSFTLSALDGLDEEEALIIGDETFTKEQIEALDSSDSDTHQIIDTDYGQLILTGYTQNTDGTITISYEYTLTDAPNNSEDGPHEDDHAFDRITITAKDRDGDSDSQTLSIKIIDDAPVAENDENNVTEGAGIDDTSITTGNVIGGSGATDGDAEDTTGADDATVTEIQFGTETEMVPDGDSVEIEGQYGTLTIHSDGSYTYELDNSNLEVQGLHPNDDPLEETFTYILTDGDGDRDDATLTINIHGQDDGVTITVPDPNDPDNPLNEDAYPDDPEDGNINDLVVFESGLSIGSSNEDGEAVDNLVNVESSFTLSALDGLDEEEALIVGGESFTKEQIGALDNSNPSTHQTVTTTYGELVLTGYELNDDGTITISYEYTLTSAPDNSDADHTDDHAFDRISITATDRDGDTNASTVLQIKIIDDAPVAEDQSAVTLDEGGKTVGYIDGDATVTGGENLLANDTQGADGARVHQIRYVDEDGNPVEFQDANGDTVTFVTVPEDENDSVTVTSPEGGTLTVHSNGNWQYISPPAETGSDDTSADHGSGDGENLPDGFQYNLIDNDGDISNWATQPINVIDTEPGVGEGAAGPQNAIVDEKYLETGTDPNEGELVVGGTLGVIKGADGIETTFYEDPNDTEHGGLEYLYSLGLKSNRDPLEYEIDSDGKLIATAGDSNRPVFTVEIIDGDSENASYAFTLQGPLDHYDGDDTVLPSIDIPFQFVVTDADGDTAEGTFTVAVTDDPPPEDGGEEDMLPFDEGGEGFLTTPANAGGSNGAEITLPNGGNPSDTEEGAPRFGTVTIDPVTGNLTYTPTDKDFSGEDSFTYTYTPPGSTTPITTTVIVTVNPVADAPDLEADKTVEVNEDGIGEDPDNSADPTGKISLGLVLPAITDDEQVEHATTFDHPERLGEITLTLGGDNLPPGTTLVYTKDSETDTTELISNGSGGYTIVIVTTSGGSAGDIDTELHRSGLAADDETINYLTEDEYKSIAAQLEEHHHENFEVEAKVSSYEVDGDGNPLDDADVGGDGNGAESTQIITVDVLAVTDIPEIELNVPDGWVNEDEGLISLEIEQPDDDNDTNAKITAAINEDTLLDLQNILTEQFKDTDGSEQFWYEVSGLPEGTVVTINGKDYTVDGSGSIEMPENDRMTVNDQNGGNPTFTITLPDHYSNTEAQAIEATITLKVLDSDTDSDVAAPQEESVSVDLALRVYAVPDDVALNTNPSTEEDTPVAFLTDLALIDGDGSETITQVRITGLPTEGGDWVLFDSEGNELTIPPGGDETGGGLVLTIGTGGNEYTLEQIGQFTLLPPAHSSLDGRMTVYITTEEHGDYTVSGDPEDKEWAHDLTITVTPVAEQVGGDTDSNTVDDLSMNDDHVYKTHGEEDGWFTLHAPGAPDNFDLKAPWSNEDDGGEETFARFTPYTTDDLRHGPEQYDSLDGAIFRYYTGADSDPADNDPAWVEVIYNGAPVDIPVAYLDTLQFKGPLNFKGIVHFKVEAHTIDYDEDDPTLTHEATSGEAWLTNLILHPVADQVTLAVTPRIAAKEDAGRDGTDPIPLNINPISDDPSETNFQVTIKGIPDGATITYTHGGTEYIIGADFDASGIDGLSVVNDTDSFSVTIDNFDIESHPTLTPPQDSNETIRLNVEARSIDTLTYTDENGAEQTITSAPGPSHELPITITLQGVPDEPSLGVKDDVSYTEDTLDSSDNLVDLKELITKLETGEISGDGSETITLRISGLGEGFSVIGAGPVVGVPNTPEDRVWVVTPEQIDNGEVQIKLPPNYSGTVSFDAQPVVTENDNPSESFFAEQKVSFTVTPSPEAKLNISSNMMEDEVGKIDFSADHQNDDTDEFISAVRFKLADGVTADIAFYSDAAGTEEITPAEDGWYTFTDPESIYAKGPANYSGEIKLEVEYKVTDPSTDGTLDPVESSNWASTDHTLNFQAVTDEVVLDLVTINGENGDSITLSEAGDVTVKLNISKAPDSNAGNASDHDGSEKLTHILIQGVPDGVAVAGAILTGSGQWLLSATDSFNGVITKDIVFQVNGAAGSITDAPISITVVTLDDGAEEPKEDTITWNLSTDFTDGEDVILPTITLTPVDDARSDEDADFALNTVVSGAVDATGANQATFDMTITLRTLPDDQTSYGPDLTRTEVQEGGETVVLWTKTVTGLTNSTAEQAVTDALAAITVSPPDHANSNPNNLNGKLPLDVTVAFHNNGVHSEDTATPEIELTPVTDEATVSIVAAPANEGEAIEIAITVSNGADEDGDWEITDDKLYLKLEDGSLPGVLKKDGAALVLQDIEGIAGLTDGQYYVIEGVSPDTPLNLTYEPTDPFANGSVKLEGWVQNQENGSSAVLSSGEQNLTVIPTNTEPDLTITATGVEHNGEDLELAQLVITGDVLADSSETLQAAFIEGLPSDFTVYYSSETDGSGAVMASNAGGGTWSIPLTSNDLPPYVAIQPPAHWSGTLEDLKLYLVSGEPDNEPTAWPVDIDLTIAPVADGVALNPTLSFGTAGDIVSLNLNADMFDPIAASPTDTHVEVTTLELTGLPDGEKVVFYANGVELGRERINFDSDTNTHTITGLTQTELNGLGILHLGTGGVIDVELKAWTQEAVLDGNGQIQRDDNGAIVTAGNPSEPDEQTVQINIADKLPTNGADNLLWTGDLIDGRDGEDTVQLRFGESLSGDTLAAKLSNIDIIDLGVSGSNSITDLTAAHVAVIIGGGNELSIIGSGSVQLGAGWTAGDEDGVYTSDGITLTIAPPVTIDESLMGTDNSSMTMDMSQVEPDEQEPLPEPTTELDDEAASDADSTISDMGNIDSPIDISGYDAEGGDTIVMDFGEDATGTELTENLSSAETLDLSIAGENSNESLSLEDVLVSNDDDSTLTILGDDEDTVRLEGDSQQGDGSYQGVVSSSETVTLKVEENLLIE